MGGRAGWSGLVGGVLWASVLLGGAQAAEFAYTVKVPAGAMECYFQNVTNLKFTALEIDFQVIDGGDLSVNFLVVNPAGTTVAQFLRRSDGTQRLDIAVRGDYQICFDNSASFQDPKTVFFELFLYDADGNLDDEDFEDMDLVKLDGSEADGMGQEAFTKSSSAIKAHLNKAEHYQAILKAWESRDRSIMDSNLARVNWWSVFNTLVLVGVGAVQVYTIRSLFEDNSKLGKLMRRT